MAKGAGPINVSPATGVTNPKVGKAIMGKLEAAGLPKSGAAALAGNWSVESAGLHTNLWQFGSSPSQHHLGQGTAGYGLAQWTDPSRQAGLKQYATAHKLPVASVGAQVGFALHEIQQTPGLFNELKTPGNAGQKAIDVASRYEAPASTSSYGERASRAQAIANTNWGVGSGGNSGNAQGASGGSTGKATRVPGFTMGTKMDTTRGYAFTQPNTHKALLNSLITNGANPDAALNPTTGLNPLSLAPKGHAITVKFPVPTIKANQVGDNPTSLEHAASMVVNKDPGVQSFNKLVKASKFIDAQNFNYEWGGGHNPSFAPTHGSGHGSGAGVGYDCSGVISRVFMRAGLLSQPLVSGQFADLPAYIHSNKNVTVAPGPASNNDPHSITIYANAEHVFSKIGDQFFGTSGNNPGGGAGYWSMSPATAQSYIGAGNAAGAYKVWHVTFH